MSTVGITSRERFVSCRKSFRADPLTMYSIDSIFNHEFSMPSFYKLIFAEFNLDLDRIYDDCEEKRVSFDQTVETLSNKLFGLSKPYVKNRLIYNYFHDLGLELMSLTNEIYARLKDYINVDDIMGNQNIVNHSDRIKEKYKQSLDLFRRTDPYSYTGVGIEDLPPILRVLNCVTNFTEGHLVLFNNLLPHLTDTFNNVIKNEYRLRVNEGDRALQRFVEISAVKQKFINENDLNKRSFGSQTFINSSFSSFNNSIENTNLYSIIPMVTAPTSGTTSTLSYLNNINTHNTITGDPLYTTLSQLDRMQNDIARNFYNPRYPKSKDRIRTNKKTPGIKRLNKSLKIISKFIPEKDLGLFLRGGEFTLDAERYRWGFRLRSRESLVKYSDNINNSSIMWDLNIYDKPTDSKLARACIVFKDSPILDNVLSTWMLLKTGKEDYILANSGMFDRGDYYRALLEPVVNEIKKKTKLEREYQQNQMLDRIGNHLEDEPRLNQELDGVILDSLNVVNGGTCSNLVSGTTLDGSRNRYQNSRRNAYLERVSIEIEIKTVIRSWLREWLFDNGMDRELYEYTTNLDVSFGEAIDYEAFQLFDVKVFDRWVKPLKWSMVGNISSIGGKKFLLNKI